MFKLSKHWQAAKFWWLTLDSIEKEFTVFMTIVYLIVGGSVLVASWQAYWSI